MKTSVVISSYNGEKYIVDMLKSIRDQTKKVDEVLICDDASTDNTVDLAKQFINNNGLSSWTIKVNKHNKGWRRNFMEGLWASHGDVVFPCDQDDLWRADKVAVMTKIMEDNPDINMLGSNWEKFYTDGKKETGPFSNDKKLHKVELYTNYMLNKLPGCTFCARRKLIDWSKKYWEPSFPHDALLWRLGLFSDSLYVIHDSLHHWRIHHDSAFAQESVSLKNVKAKKQWLKTAMDMNNSMLSFVNNHNFTNKNESLNLLKKYAKWIQLRTDFYYSRSIFTGLRLMFYWKYYPRKRQYLGDWYLIMRNQ